MEDDDEKGTWRRGKGEKRLRKDLNEWKGREETKRGSRRGSRGNGHLDFWRDADRPPPQDGFKAANAWVGHGIAWLDELQQFYRDRAAIEKEYSAKLDALAKKYFEKKNKKVSQLSVGDTPTLTPGSLER